MNDFSVALADVASAYPALEPPNRMRVSEGAARVLVIKRPGGGSGPWDPTETSYMVKPMDTLASRVHSAVCFVGPAQTGKTVALVDAWMAHAVVHDPGDMAIFQMTQDKAREFSKQRLDRAIRNSPLLRAMRSAAARDDNLHDKQFRNGMWVRIAWPTATNMASTSYRYVAGTDYDRWPDDIDGEGDGFTLMGKRTTTFLSRGMVAVESSPGRPLTDIAWTPASPHEAPPTGGILGIYNTSDRQRWYWQCPHCRAPFEATPGLSLFGLPSDDELLEVVRELDIPRFARQHARIACRDCGAIITPADRESMNRQAALREDRGWLAEGLTLDEHGRVSGTPRQSTVAGFWLGGAAATYVTWPKLIEKHLQALLDYALTGEELKLQSTANTDQGVPYMSRALAEARATTTRERYDADLERYVVPDWARFVAAHVDVQGGRNARFEVQVHAVGPYGQEALIDRYAITESMREGMGSEFAPIDPAGYAEDWDVLTEKVVQATYRTTTPGVEMRVAVVGVDSGGEEGVTERAYAWWRRLRDLGLHRNVRLTKGEDSTLRVDHLVRESMVGGRGGKGEGDVPLLLMNTNKLKDVVDACRNRSVPGPGYFHLPQPKHPALNPNGWLPQSAIDELNAEVRGEDGRWRKMKKRNETLDLCVGIKALCLWKRTDRRGFWDDAPDWAAERSRNSTVVQAEVRRAERAARVEQHAVPEIQARRVRRSSYLG